MKRSSCPQNGAGPSLKRLADNTTKRNNEWNQIYRRVDIRGTVIWSGTVEIPDSQKIMFDCSIKAPPQNEGIKSLFPLKELTIHIIPISICKSLLPHRVRERGLILCTGENTDMMSHSAFSQAIRHGSDMRGCAVLKNTASALHLLFVYSFSSGHEDYIIGFIETYQANDTVLGILGSHGVLPCANPEHGLAKQNAMLKEELQNKDKMLIEQQKLNQEQVEMLKKKMAEKEEELVRLYQEVEEQNKLAEKKQEELATSQNERDMMEKAIDEKDEEIMVKDITMMKNDVALMRKDEEKKELVKQNEALKEELQDKDKMLIEQQKLNQEQVEMHKKNMAEKEEELVKRHEEVEEQTKLAEKKQEELVKLHQEVEEQKRMAEKKQEELATSQNERDMMKKAIDEKKAEIIVKDITLMANDEALMRKDREIVSFQQKNLELQSEKEKVEEQLHRVLMKDRCLDAEREIFQETNQSNIEEDTDKTLMMETARLELENEVAMKQAALDKIDKMMENDFKCSICSQLFIKTTTLNCSHSFCAFCIQKWLSEKGTCPHCRTGVTASVRSVVLDNLIETIINKLGDEAKERRKVTVREREYDISMQEGGHLCSIPVDVETEDETSTVSSPCSPLLHLSPSASLMSPYSCPPSSASTYWRSPASIANMFSPPSVLSTDSPSPACNGSNN